MGKVVKFTTNQTSEQLAYIAGIADGEGCFYFGLTKQGKYGNGTQWHCLLKITSCDKILIEWFNNVLGGYKEMCTRYTSKKTYERPIYSWTATGPLLDYLLPKILPYLVIKKPHCELMIQIRATYANIGSRRLPENVVKLRREYMIQLRQLNSRFHNHALKVR